MLNGPESRPVMRWMATLMYPAFGSSRKIQAIGSMTPGSTSGAMTIGSAARRNRTSVRSTSHANAVAIAKANADEPTAKTIEETKVEYTLDVPYIAA
jgi:hypothetical protein